MKLKDRIITALGNYKSSDESFINFEEPIRYEIFSAEHLEQHAENLAAKQKVTEITHKGRRLTPRIKKNA
jgi:hypothetical protein